MNWRVVSLSRRHNVISFRVRRLVRHTINHPIQVGSDLYAPSQSIVAEKSARPTRTVGPPPHEYMYTGAHKCRSTGCRVCRVNFHTRGTCTQRQPAPEVPRTSTRGARRSGINPHLSLQYILIRLSERFVGKQSVHTVQPSISVRCQNCTVPVRARNRCTGEGTGEREGSPPPTCAAGHIP